MIDQTVEIIILKMSDSKKANPEVYKKVKTLGEGSFGKAYLVECQSDKVIHIILTNIEFCSYQAN
jgi:hypothetical protein